MEQHEAIQGLENAMRTNYQYVDGKMSAYLNLIATADQGMHPVLFGHLTQHEGLLETNGSVNDDTYCGQSKWQKACTAVESKWEELRDKVFSTEVSMTSEQVGELIIETLGTEKKDLNKRALLSWVLEYGDPSFIPYVEVKGLPLQAKGLSGSGLIEIRDELENEIDQIRAIRKSPMMRSPLMEAAAIQEVLDGIEDPLKRAMANALADSTKNTDPVHIIGMLSMMGGHSESLGSDFLEAVTSSLMGEKCAKCDKRGDCPLPMAENYRSEHE